MWLTFRQCESDYWALERVRITKKIMIFLSNRHSNTLIQNIQIENQEK